MALLDYPDYAMMRNKEGKKIAKPWVAGPSPISQGLLATGLAMLADPGSDWVQEGGIDLSGLGRAGLTGLSAYNKANESLQKQRQDYFNAKVQQQETALKNEKFFTEDENRKLLLKRREEKIKALPDLLDKMGKMNTPGIQGQINAIQAMASGGDIHSAYQTAVNIISQKQPIKSDIQYKKLDNGGYIIFDNVSGKYLGSLAGANTGKPSTLVGIKALAKIRQTNPDFKVQGRVNNLIAKVNPDGSLGDIKYSEAPNAWNNRQITLLNKTLDTYAKHPEVVKADDLVGNFLALQNISAHATGKVIGVADFGLIYNFMKSLDPNSVVRESEYKSASEAGLNVPDRLYRIFWDLKKGSPLLPKIRDEILEVAKSATLARGSIVNNIRKSYLNRAKKLNLGITDDEQADFFRNPFDLINDSDKDIFENL